MINYRQLVTGVTAVCLLVGFTTELSAQRRPNPHFAPYSAVSLGAGTSTYLGELNPYSVPWKSLFTLPRWNAGIGYTRYFTPRFAARAMFTWVRIVGDDYTFSKSNPEKYALQYVRNLHFRNDIKEFSVTGIYNLIPEGRNSDARPKIVPYVFAGLALVAHSPEAKPGDSLQAAYGNRLDKWVKLQPLHTEGQGQPGYRKPYSLVTGAVPVGFGARFKVNESFNIGAEISYRMTFTNYLDDVGDTYANRDALQGIAVAMADRRAESIANRVNDPRDPALQQLRQTKPELFTTPARGGGAEKIPRDGYLLTHFSIQYVIPGKIKCPPVK